MVVTPRMHGVHRSVVDEETYPNRSSGFTVRDRLRGTLRPDVPQDAVTVGVPAYRVPREVMSPKLLALPFRRELPLPPE